MSNKQNDAPHILLRTQVSLLENRIEEITKTSKEILVQYKLYEKIVSKERETTLNFVTVLSTADIYCDAEKENTMKKLCSAAIDAENFQYDCSTDFGRTLTPLISNWRDGILKEVLETKKQFESTLKEFETNTEKFNHRKEKYDLPKSFKISRELVESEKRLDQQTTTYVLKMKECLDQGEVVCQTIVNNYINMKNKSATQTMNIMNTVQMQLTPYDRDRVVPNFSSNSNSTKLGQEDENGVATNAKVESPKSKSGFLEIRQEQKFSKEGVWKRRWVQIDDGYLKCFKNYKESRPHETIPLLLCSLRTNLVDPTGRHENMFQLINNLGKIITFSASDFYIYQEWIDVIQNSITNCIEQEEKKEDHHSEALEKLKVISGNEYCVDCNKKDPIWCSVNLGVLVCLQCSGVHRSLGVHISKVQSLNLDSWNPSTISYLMFFGNAQANKILESKLIGNPDLAHVKPNPSSSNEIRAEFIKNKYCDHLYSNLTSTKTLGTTLSEYYNAIKNESTSFDFYHFYSLIITKSISLNSLSEFENFHLLKILQKMIEISDGKPDIVFAIFELLIRNGLNVNNDLTETIMQFATKFDSSQHFSNIIGIKNGIAINNRSPLQDRPVYTRSDQDITKRRPLKLPPNDQELGNSSNDLCIQTVNNLRRSLSLPGLEHESSNNSNEFETPHTVERRVSLSSQNKSSIISNNNNNNNNVDQIVLKQSNTNNKMQQLRDRRNKVPPLNTNQSIINNIQNDSLYLSNHNLPDLPKTPHFSNFDENENNKNNSEQQTSEIMENFPKRRGSLTTVSSHLVSKNLEGNERRQTNRDDSTGRVKPLRLNSPRYLEEKEKTILSSLTSSSPSSIGNTGLQHHRRQSGEREKDREKEREREQKETEKIISPRSSEVCDSPKSARGTILLANHKKRDSDDRTKQSPRRNTITHHSRTTSDNQAKDDIPAVGSDELQLSQDPIPTTGSIGNRSARNRSRERINTFDKQVIAEICDIELSLLKIIQQSETVDLMEKK